MILAIDIGGTSAKLGLVEENGTLHDKSEVSVCFDNYETPILTTVVAAAQSYFERFTGISGIGVSATGQIDDKEGIVIGTNGKIPHYEGAAIKATMEGTFLVPCFALNDANAAALGECFVGRGRGTQNLLMVTLGTGVGGGIVIGGRVFGGTRGIAGEMGQMRLDKERTFETVAATSALVKRAGTKHGREVFDRAALGDKVMLKILSDWLDNVSYGIVSLVHLLNPEIVLIGGGVSKQETLLMEPLREKCFSMILPRFKENLRIEAAELGNDAGLIGAAKFCMDNMK